MPSGEAPVKRCRACTNGRARCGLGRLAFCGPSLSLRRQICFCCPFSERKAQRLSPTSPSPLSRSPPNSNKIRLVVIEEGILDAELRVLRDWRRRQAEYEAMLRARRMAELALRAAHDLANLPPRPPTPPPGE